MDAASFLDGGSTSTPMMSMVVRAPAPSPMTQRMSPEDIVKAFIERGYSPAGAEGIARNVTRESGGNPDIMGDGGTSGGMFQHHASRLDELKAYAQRQGKTWQDPLVQIDFADYEMRTKFPKLRTQLSETDDPGDANESFKRIFERPAGTIAGGYGNLSYSPFAMSEHLERPDTSVVHMSPDDYLALSPELENPWGDSAGRSLKRSLARGDQIESLPSLMIKPSGDGSAEVTDQDGRHRALAAQEAGASVLPVAVQGVQPGQPLTELKGMTGNILPFDFPTVNTEQDAAGQGAARQGKAGQGEAWHGVARQGEAGQGIMGAVMGAIMPSASAAEMPKPQMGQGAQQAAQPPARPLALEFLEQKSAAPAPAPADKFLDQPPMGRLESLGTGVADVLHQGARYLTDALPAPVVEAGNSLNNWLAQNTGMVAPLPPGGLQQADAAREAAIQAQRGDNGWRTGGQILGQVGVGAAAAPMLGALGVGAAAMPAATGAVAGAMQPTKTDSLSQLAWNTILGGAGGAAGGSIANAVSRIAAPPLNALTRQMADAGVRMTPGQIMGGVLQRAENAATSIPLVGQAIRNAMTKSIQTFNKSAIDQALAPIGESLPADIQAGRNAIGLAQQKVSAAYDRILSNAKFTPDRILVTDLQYIARDVAELPKVQQDQFKAIMNNRVIQRFMQGPMDGKTYKLMESDLTRQIGMWRGSSVSGERQLGHALSDVKDALKEGLERSNPPGKAREIAAANQSYAMLSRAEDASMRRATPDGVFSPADLLQSVKAAARRSGNRKSFARGDAMLQKFAEAAQDVLPSKVPDSGSPERLLHASGLVGGAGLLGGADAGIGTLAGLLGGRAIYSQPALSGLNALVQRPGPTRAALADLISQAGKYVAPAAGVELTNALTDRGQ